MKGALSRKVCAALIAAFAAFTVPADTIRVSSSYNFARYCGSGNKYKKYDKIILESDITLTSDIELKKNLVIISEDGENYTIAVNNARQIAIDPGYKLSLTNVTFDGYSYTRRNEGLFYLNESSDTNKIARLELGSGTTIKNVTVTTDADADHAPIHVKKGARLLICEGSAILNCRNESYHGNGGAICCDSGNIIMNGGTIAGCSAKGSGGAIRVTGTRNAAEDHLGVAMRGDIFLYGGTITGNVCGDGAADGAECFGGGIYLGDTGPMLHVIGPVVVSNNFCVAPAADGSSQRIADDVSTYLLDDDYANRLKLSGDDSGLMFTEGWIGVRYPDARKLEAAGEDVQSKRFGGVWEYFPSTHEESRQFFWNGDNRYRGWITGNALVWTRYNIYQLPLDRAELVSVLNEADTNFPVYIEFNDGFIMNKEAYGDSHIRIRDGFEVIFDLQGHSVTCNIEVANGGHVTFRDSSPTRSGKVYGYRGVASDIVPGSPAYTNAYTIEGGSYRTKPDPAWVASNRVVIGNYCEVHPWMVARLAWETNLTSRVADVTLTPLETVDNEIRDVTDAADIGNITYSTGDWVRNAHTNANLHVRVLAAPAVSNAVTGVLEESGPRVVYFDTAVTGGIVDGDNVSLPDNAANDNIAVLADANGNAASFGREDAFVWNAMTYGLVKLIHVTYTKTGTRETTNAVEQAYFRFPDAAFRATQRKTGGTLPITVVDTLLGALGFSRAGGFLAGNVDRKLDARDPNGLRRWENLVTGTATNHLLISTAVESGDGETLSLALTEPAKTHRTDTDYSVFYDLRKSTPSGWTRVGEVKERPDFSIPLLDADGKSKNASGFYRVTTMIVPDGHLSVTNEIPSTNIVGVLEIASTFTNTLTAVPWVALATDPTNAAPGSVTVSNYLHTAHLETDDGVQVADKGHIFRGWKWHGGDRKWKGAATVTREAVIPAAEPEEYEITRDSAVWVTRGQPEKKPFFLVGQYSSEAVTLAIAAGTEEEPVCTLVPNPGMAAVGINDYPWNGKPTAKDLIRIPNEKSHPIVLRWKNGAWGRFVYNPQTYLSEWRTDQTVPAGTGFWYHRCGESFELTLPTSSPEAE